MKKRKYNPIWKLADDGAEKTGECVPIFLTKAVQCQPRKLRFFFYFFNFHNKIVLY